MEALIESVQKNSAIWNKYDKNHHNNYVLSKLWEEVAKESGLPQSEAKGKWKRLRETFSKKFTAVSSKKSGDAGGKMGDVKWPYFQSLMFLRDQFTPRKTTDSFSEELSSELSNNENIDEDTTELDAGLQFALSPSPGPSGSPSCSNVSRNSAGRKRPQSMDPLGLAFLNAEREKLQYLKQKEDTREKQMKKDVDEDISFFNSLLPHVRSLAPRQKMRFRIKVMQLIEEEFNDMGPNNVNQPHILPNTFSVIAIPNQHCSTNATTSDSILTENNFAMEDSGNFENEFEPPMP